MGQFPPLICGVCKKEIDDHETSLRMEIDGVLYRVHPECFTSDKDVDA